MKRIISFIAAAVILTASLPAARAADGITPAEVEKIMSKHALVNNEEDYGHYTQDISDETNEIAQETAQFIDAKSAYLLYSIKDNSKKGDLRDNYFVDNHEATSVMEGLTEDYNYNEHEYIFRDKTNPYVFGFLVMEQPDFGGHSLSGYTNEPALNNAHFTFYSHEAIAQIINENELKNIDEIIAVENNFINYDALSVIDNELVYIRSADGEYILTDVRYTDGELTHYALLDSEAFIEAMRGNYEKAREYGYNRFSVKTPPTFTDISNDSAVTLLSRMGIISGYEDGAFRGDNYVTRAEAARMLALATAPQRVNIDGDVNWHYTSIFTDFDDTHWASKYIQYGQNQGYINGKEKTGETTLKKYAGVKRDENGRWIKAYTDKTVDTYAFYPEDTVTEQELVKMLVSAVDGISEAVAQAEGGFPDGYLFAAKRLGICEAASDSPATRLTAAHMIKNAIDARVAADEESTHKISYDENEFLYEFGYETVYSGKTIFYNKDLTAKRIKLTGKITDALLENEYGFTIGADSASSLGEYKTGDKVTLLDRYGDLSSFIGQDCDVYCELCDGNLVAIMAE